MVASTVNVGSLGKWTVTVTGTADQANWRTLVRVQLSMYNGGTQTAFNNDGASMQIQSAVLGNWSSTVAFNVSAKATDIVVDRSYYVTHDAAGNLSLTVKGILGATGTTTFGSGGNTSVTYVGATLASVPGAPGQPVIGAVTNNSAVISFADGGNGGLAITDRRIYYSTTNQGETAPYITSDGSDTLTGLAGDTTYYVWGRTYNSLGWGAFSVAQSFKTKSVPLAPTAPTITNIRQTSFGYLFTLGGDGGTTIDGAEVAYSLTDGGTKTSNTVPFSPTTGTITGLPKDPTTGVQGLDLYIYVRAHNAYGWGPYSLPTKIKVLAGSFVYAGGVSKAAVPYVRDGGVWKLAEPNILVGSVWKLTGQ